MDMVLIGVLLGLFGGHLGLWYTVSMIKRDLFAPSEDPQPLDLSPLVDAIKEGLRTDILDTIGNMRQPTAQDHIMAMLNAVVMSKIKLPNIDMPSILSPENGEAQTHQ